MSISSLRAIILFLLSCSCLLLLSLQSEAGSHSGTPLVEGLSWRFYESSCPKLESIVRRHLWKELRKDIGLAAGLLRLHFHDCFVQGCDGSILLAGTESNPSEQASIPNLSLRPKALAIINELKDLIENVCGNVVSCADVVAVAARDSVFLSWGPHYDIPFGRRDGLTFASNATTLANLPAPFFDVSTLLSAFASKGLNATNLVALSGAHTIGRAHCTSFTNRLYPSQDPTLDSNFAHHLYATCPSATSPNTTALDVTTPNAFDNKFYINLVNHKGLFTSDQGLFGDERTKSIVEEFAKNKWLFFEKFGEAMVKMGQVSVLTGVKGEVRRNCSVINSGLLSVVEGEVGRDVVA